MKGGMKLSKPLFHPPIPVDEALTWDKFEKLIGPMKKYRKGKKNEASVKHHLLSVAKATVDRE